MGLQATPRVARHVIVRERLEARLAADTALVVVCAPAGYGKSALLTSWASRTTRRGVWLAAPAHPTSVVDVVADVAEALVEAGLVTESGSPLRRTDLRSRDEAEAWSLLHRGIRGIAGEVCLVIDDGDTLAPAVLHGLTRAVAELPSLTVRIAQRTASLLVEPALDLRVDVDVLDAADLALTPDEAVQVLGADAADDELAWVLVHGAVPILTRLLAMRRQGTSLDDLLASLLRMRTATMEEPLVRFAETIALATETDMEFAAELTGEQAAEAMMDRLESEGFGQWSMPRPRTDAAVFALSPPLRQPLLERFRRRENPAQLRAASVRVVRNELARGRAHIAIQGAVTLHDWELAAQIVREHWMEMLEHAPRLAASLRSVDPAELRRWPYLTMMLALTYDEDELTRPRALQYFALAARAAHRERSRVTGVERVFVIAIEVTARRLLGDVVGAGETARVGYDLLRAGEPGDGDLLRRSLPVVYVQLGMAFMYEGDVVRAQDCFDRAAAEVEGSGNPLGLQGMALRAGLLAIRGDMGEAQRALRHAEARVWPSGWERSYHGCFLAVARGLIALEEGDLDAAERTLADVGEHRERCEHWALLLHLELVVALLRGQPEVAHVRLEAMITVQTRRHAVNDTSRQRLGAIRRLILLSRGALDEARQQLDDSRDPDASIARARLALAAGDARGARRLLSGGGEGKDARTRAAELALAAAADCLLDPAAEATVTSLRDLHALLVDRRLFLAMALVPRPGLIAMAEVSERVGMPLLAVIRRALELAPIDGLVERPRLSPRELVVARHLARTDSVAEIGAALVVSPNTVKSQLRSLYRKLGVRTRGDALQELSVRGLIADEVVG